MAKIILKLHCENCNLDFQVEKSDKLPKCESCKGDLKQISGEVITT